VVKNPRSRPAFTFIEVLFAVILLGIGFIMIAAVFPVAIQQTSAISDETQGTLLAQDAIKKIQAVADGMNSNTLFPATGTTANPQVWAITTTPPSPNTTPVNILGGTTPPPGLLGALGADSLYSADRRFGWVGFYRRDSVTSPFAQIYIVALQNPNFANYLYPVPTAGQTTISSPVPPPIPPGVYGFSSVSAASIPAQFFYNADGSTTVVLSYSTSTSPAQTPNGIAGAYVLIGGPIIAGSPPTSFVRRVFRVGNTAPLPASITATGTTIYQTFTLQPGSDISPSDAVQNTFVAGAATPAFSAAVWIMGSAPMPDAAGGYSGPFSGPNQDIGVASGFIRVNTTNN